MPNDTPVITKTGRIHWANEKMWALVEAVEALEKQIKENNNNYQHGRGWTPLVFPEDALQPIFKAARKVREG